MNANNLIGFMGHLTIVGSILAKGGYLVRPILSATTSIEGLMRGSALASGVMLSALLRAAGLSYASLLLVVMDRWYLYYPVGVALPLVVGILVAQFAIDSMQRSTNLAIRVVLLIGAFTLAQFVELYAVALVRSSISVSKMHAPNLVFAITVALYFVFSYDADRPDAKT